MSAPVQRPASNSEARKRGERYAHPDPAVRDLLARAWEEGRADGHSELRPINAFGNTAPARNPYRSAS